MSARAILIVVVALLGACSGAQAPDVKATAEAQNFDREASQGLLSEARQAAIADPTTAIPLYRAAGLRWPDNLEAWERLAEAAQSGESVSSD